MTVYLKEYDGVNIETAKDIDTKYTLKINYVALDYFNLINNFQFSIPIYLLLFNLVAFIQLVGIVIFWLSTLAIKQAKEAPNIRFKHLVLVTGTAPLAGSLIGMIPALVVAIWIYIFQQSTLFQDVNANWTDMGNDISPK
jgi:hypothetical protein